MKPTIWVSGLGPKTVVHYSLDFEIDVDEKTNDWTLTYKGSETVTAWWTHCTAIVINMIIGAGLYALTEWLLW